MRGAGDELSVGDRIAFYRRRRGLTQATFGALVGRSEEWVSSIERGRRQVRRLDVLDEVARALRVSLPDLLGQPVLMEDDHQDDDIPAVRDALMAPRRLSRILYPQGDPGPAVDVTESARFAEQVWFEYQAGRVGRVVAVLPGLIGSAQELEGRAPNPEAGWAVSARIHHLASTTLSKVGEADLAWIAAERAMYAAEQADDPLALASAARAGTHAFLANGRFDEAMNLGATAAEWLSSHMSSGDPAALSLFGMLNLRTAIAAARRHDRSTAAELLKRAALAAALIGRDAKYWQTSFGPSNVELHRLSAALDLGDVSSVLDRMGDVRTDDLPAERAVTHLIDMGRALSLVARDDEALARFLDAELKAPQLVRHSPGVREAVKTMYRRAPATGQAKSSPLMGLALRCRALT